MAVKLKPLSTDTGWWALERSAKALKSADAREWLVMLEQILVIRIFEEKLLELSVNGVLHGPAHSSIGQEGAAVGAMSCLRSQDKINGTHRMHHQFLAKALNHVTPAAYNPTTDEPTDAMRTTIYRTYAEILGLTPGYCGGRGGSMHLRYPEAGILGSNAIVGGNQSHAVGYALADKLRGEDFVSVAFFGDGATQTGATYEAMNLAALYKTPTIFFIENNLYAVSTNVSEQTGEPRLSARGLSLGIPSISFDGMDVVASREAMLKAREIIAEQGGPVLLEARTYRYFHQSGALKGSAFGYRSKEEEDTWSEKDPHSCFPRELIQAGLITQEQLDHIDERAKDMIDNALARLVSDYHDADKQQIRPELWPDPATVDEGIRGDLSQLSACRTLEEQDIPVNESKEVRFIDVISAAMLNNMKKRDNIFILGEDVHRLRGGTAGATRNIGEVFPDRLIGTPICENGFTGMALGAALNGMRPVVEIMYPDFSLVAADQLFNQIAKVRHMFGGGFDVPVIVRSRVSAGTGYGSQHSMDAAGLFAQYPGWRILAPSTPHDYIGLLNAAFECSDPVLIVEYNNLFRQRGRVPADDLDFIVPIGKARMVREGSRLTILTYGTMVKACEQAAEDTGIDAEVIDLRTLDPLGLDWETIENSVRKTNALAIIESTTRGTSIGSRVVSDAQKRLFDWLDHEILHITGSESSPVVSKVLEQAAFAGREHIVEALQTIDRNRGGRTS